MYAYMYRCCTIVFVFQYKSHFENGDDDDDVARGTAQRNARAHWTAKGNDDDDDNTIHHTHAHTHDMHDEHGGARARLHDDMA